MAITRSAFLSLVASCTLLAVPSVESEEEPTGTGGDGGECTAAEEQRAHLSIGSEVSTLTIFLYITIFLSFGIQYVREYLHHKTTNYPHIRELLEGVCEELSSVGVTAFMLFMLETSTLPQHSKRDRLRITRPCSMACIWRFLHRIPIPVDGHRRATLFETDQ
jgi:hypothetical protein